MGFRFDDPVLCLKWIQSISSILYLEGGKRDMSDQTNHLLLMIKIEQAKICDFVGFVIYHSLKLC